MHVSNFLSMAMRISRLRANQGRFCFDKVEVYNLKAFAYWIWDLQRQNKPIVTHDIIEMRDKCQHMVANEKMTISQAGIQNAFTTKVWGGKLDIMGDYFY